MKIKITRQHWNALLTVIAKKDVRFYLNTICIDLKENKIVATDGHRLLTIDHELPDSEVNNQVLVDLSLTEHKASNKVEYVTLDISDDMKSFSEVQITYYNSKDVKILALFTRICDGEYPDYNRVIPTKSTKEVLTLEIKINPEYLTDVSKALKGVGINNITINKITDDMIKVGLGDDAVNYYVMLVRA